MHSFRWIPVVLRKVLVALLVGANTSGLTFAQEPNLASSNINYSNQVYHVVAKVSLEEAENQYTRYQYDRYSDVERIKSDQGTFARKKGQAWKQSDDWADTGKPVDKVLGDRLDFFAAVANIVFQKPEDKDSSQGKPVWKFIRQSQSGAETYFTYERSRERPRPDGDYPRYTFVKWKDDVDGSLLLDEFEAQLRLNGKLIPVAIKYDYYFPLPPGTKVLFGPPPTNSTNPPGQAPATH